MPGKARLPLLEALRERHPEATDRALVAAIMRGMVRVDGEPILKPGVRIARDSRLELRSSPAYVSRGGLKLHAALTAWGIEVRGLGFIDAGSSTGGFTDCLLREGASFVHCVDVGIGQLAWSLRIDRRVRLHEGTNVMRLAPDDLQPRPHAAVADLSFRSLRKAAARILSLTRDGWGIFLVKPQFEWRQPPPEFRGVVEDREDRAGILRRLLDELRSEGVQVRRMMASPFPGRRGNREFLALMSASAQKRQKAGEDAAATRETRTGRADRPPPLPQARGTRRALRR